MIRPTACALLVATALLSTASTPSPAAMGEAHGRERSPAAAAADPTGRGGEPGLVMEIAQRCLDGRHVALVGNAMRQGRVFQLDEALSWCS